MLKRTRRRLKIVAILVVLCMGLLLIAHMLVFHLNWLIALNAWAENKRFEFVGQVVDVYGKPVMDAEVEAVFVRANTTAMLDGKTVKYVNVATRTDVDGKFRITANGNEIGILDITKEGYRWIRELDIS